MTLALEQVSVAVLLLALLLRAATALRRPRYRWLWFGCAAMTISIVIYVSAVADWRFLWAPLDKCGLSVNIWGICTSAAIAVFSTLAAGARRSVVATVATAYLLGGIFVVADGLNSTPSPIGCLDRVHVPWHNAFWWVLILIHITATTYAAVVCWRFARVLWGKPSMRAEFVVLGAGMLSSTLFWCGILTILISGTPSLIGPLQYGISSTSLLLAVGLTWGLIRGGLDRVAAVRAYRSLEPLDDHLNTVFGDVPARSPGTIELLTSVAYPPRARLFRLRVSIRDRLLEADDFAAGRRGSLSDERMRRVYEAMTAQGWRREDGGAAVETDLMHRVAAELGLGKRIPGSGRHERKEAQA